MKRKSRSAVRGNVTAMGMCMLVLLSGCAVVPQAIPADQQKEIALKDRQAAQANVEPLKGKLTLSEALARALKYNLDHRTRMMEEALALGQLDLSRYDMLPKLTAAAGYNWRDSDRITRSKDSVTGAPSLANPYISSDRDHTTESLGLSWNVLDFGVSYYNAKQNADRVLVAAERRRKAMHNLMQDVRTAYWRAASAQKIESDLRSTLKLAEDALNDSRKVEAEKLRDPMEALRYQRTLLENLRVLESIQRELAASRIELAALINLPPGSDYELADPSAADLAPVHVSLAVDRMEELAIANNADLKEQFYNARMTVAETKKSILRLLPGLSFNYSYQHDSDSYLINKSWQEAGLQISWNLFNILSAPSAIRYSEANEKLAEQRRMATQMAVLAQVHLARQQYESSYVLFERADAIWRVDQRIYEHSSNRETVEMKGRLDRISNNTSAIVSYLRRFQALSQVYAASSKVQATLGQEPSVGNLQEIALSDLTAQIDADAHRGSWARGVEQPAPESKPVVAEVNVGSTVPAAPKPAAPVSEAAPAANPVAPVAVSPAAPATAAPAEVVIPAAVGSATHLVYLADFRVPNRGPSLTWQNVKQEGVEWAAEPAQADVLASGRLLLGKPGADGHREAAIEWTLKDAQGKELKQVRHVGSVSKPASNEDWRVLKQGAVAALADAFSGK